MPKIVDKLKKRREIALACGDLFLEVGIKKVTVSQLALAANIGKGTIYEYFENKEDIIFEIISSNMEKYHEEFLEKIKKLRTTKEKVFCFFYFVLDDSEENLKHFSAYQEYLSIVLSDNNEAMKAFNKEKRKFFEDELKKVIKEGINNVELIPQALDLCEGLLIFKKGLSLLKMSEDNFDTKVEFEKFINTIFDIIEIKK